jgi:lipopolysaccharide assembly LptE-like protein
MGRLFLLIVAGLLSGCLGYTVGPVQPTYMKGIHRLAVPILKNNTVEPDVDTLATTTLIKQLQQDGTYEVTSLDRADAEVRGVIDLVQRAAVRSVVGNVLAASEFSLQVKVRFEVVNPKTGAVLGARDVYGTSSFFVQNDIQTQEHQAIPLAVEDAAVQMASYLSEGW